MTSISWFYDLFGFHENLYNYEDIQNQFILNNNILISKSNNKSYNIGNFQLISLKNLRELGIEYLTKLINNNNNNSTINLSFSSIFSDINFLPIDDSFNLAGDYPGSVIQVASQFNCLEFIHPNIIPELGVTVYADDHTQGPSCAMSCGAGTVYRNYFYKFSDDTYGQRKHQQINNLDEFEKLISNHIHNYFTVQNGYVFSTSSTSLNSLNNLINNNIKLKNELRDSIKVGSHWNVGVTFDRNGILSNEITATQVYSSAISVGYDNNNPDWAPVAKLVLEAKYEAILWISVIQKIRVLLNETQEMGNEDKLFLSLLGGGVFCNEIEWILAAIKRALNVVENTISSSFPSLISSSSNSSLLTVNLCYFRIVNETHKHIYKSIEV